MAIRITCPGCKSSLTLADELRGKKVRCKKCETSIKIPDANGAKRQREEEETDADERQANSPEDDNDEEEEEEERPAKKKKKKKAAKGISPVLIIVPVALVVLLLVGGVSAFFFTRDARPAAPKENQQAKVEPKVEEEVQQPQIFNKIQDGSPTKKGGTGIVSNIRGAVYRTERKSELKQIALAYQQFSDEYKGANRTKENFLEFVKNFGPIRNAIKDGYYVVNMKARPEGASIVAYERDMDHPGYLCAMGDGDVRYVPEPEWKAALGK